MTPLVEQLDERLKVDCHLVAEAGGLVILLHRNALIPWFILVPLATAARDELKADDAEAGSASAGIFRELFEIPPKLRQNLMSASDILSHYLLRRFEVDKVNLAAIGNIVPQFHWHVVGRNEADPLWPSPVWGNLGDRFEAWPDDELLEICQEVERLVETLPAIRASSE